MTAAEKINRIAILVIVTAVCFVVIWPATSIAFFLPLFFVFGENFPDALFGGVLLLSMATTGGAGYFLFNYMSGHRKKRLLQDQEQAERERIDREYARLEHERHQAECNRVLSEIRESEGQSLVAGVDLGSDYLPKKDETIYWFGRVVSGRYVSHTEFEREGVGFLVISNKGIRFLSDGIGRNWTKTWNSILRWSLQPNGICFEASTGAPSFFYPTNESVNLNWNVHGFWNDPRVLGLAAQFAYKHD